LCECEAQQVCRVQAVATVSEFGFDYQLRPLRLLLVLMRRERFVCRTIILPKPTEHHLDRMAAASTKGIVCARPNHYAV
jgi:hypothetical protein